MNEEYKEEFIRILKTSKSIDDMEMRAFNFLKRRGGYANMKDNKYGEIENETL